MMRVALLQLCARELRRGGKADRLSDALATEERGGRREDGGGEERGGSMNAGKEGQSRRDDGRGTFSRACTPARPHAHMHRLVAASLPCGH